MVIGYGGNQQILLIFSTCTVCTSFVNKVYDPRLEIFFPFTITTAMALSPDLDVLNRRKCKVNSRLLDDNNVSSDAVKRCKVESLRSAMQAQAPLPPQNPQADHNPHNQ